MNTLTTYLNKLYTFQPKILLVYRPTERSSWKDRCLFLQEGYNPNTQYNHRSVLFNEVIIEYDGKDVEENKRLVMDVAQRLRKDKMCFSIWYSGNRSYHLHIFINLKEASNIPLLKKTLIRYYTKGLPIPDLRLCAQNHLIRAEFGIHEKTKKNKTIIEYIKGYPKINDIKSDIWKLYVEEQAESVLRRTQYAIKDITTMPGFKHVLASEEFRANDDGRERALFMLIHVLYPEYKDRKNDLIQLMQEWYKYSGGFKLSPGQISYKTTKAWEKHYTISEKYLNELLESIGRKDLIVKEQNSL